MDNITLKQFQASCLATWNSSDKDQKEQLFHATLGLTGEAGEVANKVKKHFFRAKPNESKFRDELKDELGDVLYYHLIVCDLYDFDLQEIFKENMEKRNARLENGYYDVSHQD